MTSKILTLLVFFFGSFSLAHGQYATDEASVETLARITCYRAGDNLFKPGVVVLDQIPTPHMMGNQTVYLNGDQFINSKRTESSFRVRLYEDTLLSNPSEESANEVALAETENEFEGRMVKIRRHFSLRQAADNLQFGLQNNDLEYGTFIWESSDLEKSGYSGQYTCLEPYTVPNPAFNAPALEEEDEEVFAEAANM